MAGNADALDELLALPFGQGGRLAIRRKDTDHQEQQSRQ
jgi:hypothetical protein